MIIETLVGLILITLWIVLGVIIWIFKFLGDKDE